MGHLVVPLKAVYPFWAQAANHPLPGDLAYADGSVIATANQAINSGSSYTLPDLRNTFVIGADPNQGATHPGQYINFISTISAANGWNFQYADQWGNATHTITTGDYLVYDVYWPSSTIPASGGGCGAVDLYFQDGSVLRSFTANDQNGLAAKPTTDLRTYALDQWYTRIISLAAVGGKAVNSLVFTHQPTLAFTNLTNRFRNIYIGDSVGNVRVPYWMGGDGTPKYSTSTQNNGSFVSGNASALTAPGPDGVGGTNKFTVKPRHIPVHTHTATTGSAGSHTHSVNSLTHSSHTHAITGGVSFALFLGNDYAIAGSGFRTCSCVGTTIALDGSHSHTVSPGNDGSHEHTVTISTAQGPGGTPNAGGLPFDTRPRYLSTVWCVKSGKPTARLQSIPMGSIIMWYADLINETLPAGFSATDGSSLTAGNHIVPNQSGSISYTLVLPDTRNRYLIGADRTKAFGAAGIAASDLPTDAPGPGATGGTHVANIDITNLPDHDHASVSTTGNPWATHNHTWTVPANANHTHNASSLGYSIGTNSGATDSLSSGGTQIQEYKSDPTNVSTITTTDSHSHTLSITASGGHTHSVTVNSTGSGGSWDGRVPFIGIVYLMRTNIGLLSTPLKTVIGFRSTATNEALVPTDGTWALCDGSTLTAGQFDMAANSGANYVLPNFSAFFPLGADRTKAAGNAGGATDTAADAPGPKGTAGSNTVTLTSTTMPTHIHVGSTDNPAAATHDHGTTALTSTDPGHTHGTGCQTWYNTTTLAIHTYGINTATSNPPSIASSATTFVSTTQPAHTPTVSTTGSHTHTVTVPNAGTGSAMQQRPRHHGLVFYMKVKR